MNAMDVFRDVNLLTTDDMETIALRVCPNRRMQPSCFEAAVELMAGDIVAITRHDSQLSPGHHATTGQLGNRVDDHDVIHVVVVVVVVVFIVFVVVCVHRRFFL
jgi:hypothetical protein